MSEQWSDIGEGSLAWKPFTIFNIKVDIIYYTTTLSGYTRETPITTVHAYLPFIMTRLLQKQMSYKFVPKSVIFWSFEIRTLISCTSIKITSNQYMMFVTKKSYIPALLKDSICYLTALHLYMYSSEGEYTIRPYKLTHFNLSNEPLAIAYHPHTMDSLTPRL